jgi:ABC-type branched-subunit amino acid transport system ATPase component/ABC-type branched-subunit amino acid transport system permease subunit
MITAVDVVGLEVTSGLVALGVISGMTYGLLAVGLVLAHRSSKVINFAHGEIGAFGAAVCGLLVVRFGLPYFVALVAGVLVSALAGGLTEAAVVRRMKRAPRIMSLVATLGVAQFLLLLSAVVNSEARASSRFPQPPWFPEFTIDVLLVTRAYSAMLIISPLVVLALVLFLRRSRFGLGIRAASANEERAIMAGISAGRMSTLAWSLGGALAALTVVLLIPTRGFITAETLGPVLLLRALTPAVIARMTSMPVALGAGVAVGVIDQILVFNYPTSGVSELALLVLIAGALLLQTRQGGRVQERQDWSATQPWPVLPEALREIRSVRLLAPVTAGVALAIALLVGLLSSNSAAVSFIAILVFSLLGLSLGITTGLAGQLSLGQFALAGVGAVTGYLVLSVYENHLLAIAFAGVVSAAVSMLLGLPALRVRGLLLGVITLSFALAAQRWLLRESWALGAGVGLGRPRVGSFEITSTRGYYFWSLGVFVFSLWLAWNVWRGGIGRRLRAARDNEDALRAFGVSATAVKMQGFAIAGLLAGFSGVLYGQLLSRITADSFDVITSIRAVALTVLGGIGLLGGPVLGALYIVGLPRFVPLDNAGLAATSLGWLLLILYFPGGLAEVLARPRRLIIDLLARRAGIDPDAVRRGEDAAVERGATFEGTRTAVSRIDSGSSPPADVEILVCTGLVKHFGGVHAVDGVDLRLGGREVLGLLGPNGAGKTTLFELIGGFTPADAGSILFDGREIARLPAHARAQLGVVRSFQDAALFPTLTVLETVMLAHERQRPTPLTSIVGVDATATAKQAQARDLVALMGLDAYRNKQIRELSTGTRRITELACVLALEPRVLLLDEPSSGIAQRESEALGGLLLRIRDALGCALIVIEHDIPLLTGMSDRLMAMDTGRVIAEGDPAGVRSDPVVVESYLGGNAAAIERSTAVVAAR